MTEHKHGQFDDQVFQDIISGQSIDDKKMFDRAEVTAEQIEFAKQEAAKLAQAHADNSMSYDEYSWRMEILDHTISSRMNRLDRKKTTKLGQLASWLSGLRRS